MEWARLRAFEGRLLDLIARVRAGSVQLADVPLAALAAECAALAEAAARLDPGVAMEVVDAAALLIEWKSRSLLPAVLEAADSPETEGTRRKLAVDLEQVQGAMALLSEALAASQGIFVHGEREMGEEPGEEEDDNPVTLAELIRLFERLRDEIREQKRQPVVELARPEFTTEQMLASLREQLAREERLDASALLAASEPPERRMALFLALLEGARQRACRLEQAETFATLHVIREAA